MSILSVSTLQSFSTWTSPVSSADCGGRAGTVSRRPSRCLPASSGPRPRPRPGPPRSRHRAQARAPHPSALPASRYPGSTSKRPLSQHGGGARAARLEHIFRLCGCLSSFLVEVDTWGGFRRFVHRQKRVSKRHLLLCGGDRGSP